jgi:hypothetical protein
MEPTARARTAALVLGLLVLCFAACQTQPTEPQPPRVVGPQLFDCRDEGDEEPAECRHVWQQVGVHGYTKMIHGIPSVELCSVLRCTKCGQVRHECRPPPRR